MPIPDFTAAGELPLGVHQATLVEVVARFGTGSRRTRLARRLERIYALAADTGALARFVLLGSFVTDKAEPNDIDVFIVMENGFTGQQLALPAAVLFDHLLCQAHHGASVC